MIPCLYCEMTFRGKDKLNKHLERKKPCYFKYYDLQDNVQNISSCPYCKKTFSEKRYLHNHLNGNCRDKNAKILKILQEQGIHKENVEIFRDKIVECKNKINELKKTISNYEMGKYFIDYKRNNNLFLTNIILGNDKLKINPLGSENIDFIEESEFNKIISIPSRSLGYLNNILNFSKDRMDNWSIQKNNAKTYLYLNKKNEWTPRNTDEIIEMLWKIRKNQLKELENKYGKHISPKLSIKSVRDEAINYLKIKFLEGIAQNDFYILSHPNEVKIYFNNL